MRSFVLQNVLFFSAIYLRTAGTIAPPRPLPVAEKVSDDVLAALADPRDPTSGISYFKQYIDHSRPGLGTFKQTFWYNTTFWQGPGSPIILFTPGESAASEFISYLGDQALTGLIAKEVGGAVVMVEHRYWGNSTPYKTQSTKNLQFLNLDQAVADFVRFARAAELPFDKNGSSNAPKVPYVWVGGSYSGALGAWIESLAPGTFWATHASSGPVEAIYEYWQYFYAIQDGMPKNCSKDYSAIVDYVDKVFTHGSHKEKADLKQLFGLQDVQHLDDAASAICSPIWAWQSIQLTSGYPVFYQMCDAIEGALSNSTAHLTNSDGVGLKKALPNFAKWFKAAYLPGYCAGYGYKEWEHRNSVACFDTYNATSPLFTDHTAANTGDRPWVWMTCNDPFFYYQTGAPVSRPTIFTRLATARYYQRQCKLYFPQEGEYTFASALGKTAADINAHTKGWHLPESLDVESRLLFVNGEFDPWRSASVASKFRPGGPLPSTPAVPHIVIPGSRHCNDLLISNSVNKNVATAINHIVAHMKSWTLDFYDPANCPQDIPSPRCVRVAI
ncbi:endoprotease endo-Pro [Whalleya microplaca]|nr:endoprotease endo-Pro [Whalleya microplaca]